MEHHDDFAKQLRPLIEPVAGLLALLPGAEAEAAEELRAVTPEHAESARNLVHYVELRRHDLRALQDRLASVGLSSLGRAESCVAETLSGVVALMSRSCGLLPGGHPDGFMTLETSRRRLVRATEKLLGRSRNDRRVRILVTLPAEIAHDPGLVRELMRAGMDAVRINCAHDDPPAWEQMISHVRQAATELSVDCRVLMDLPGPKLRTGALEPGPRVVKLKPQRNALGGVLEPARAWLGAAETAPPGVTRLPVPAAWLAALRADDVIDLVDARDSKRRFRVTEATDSGSLVESRKTAYITTGMRLRHAHGDCVIGELPPVDQPLILRKGDTLLVTRDGVSGCAGPPARITCTLPQVFADVRAGHRIWFDDGAIGGRVRVAGRDHLDVEITDARPDGSKLRADKGINLPDTALELPPLDARDEANLAFVASHADLVGFSFVRRPSDVLELQDRLAALGRRDLGVVLKIETREGFENLPAILLAAMRRPIVGVMIARGDLAIECGWERLAELQEEILWICEAAHLPVIWATQVLEQLAKEGRASRAEITDAAMSGRAECVMLNKGEHIVEAVQVLDNILRRMERHQTKKRSMLRPLALAEHFGMGHT